MNDGEIAEKINKIFDMRPYAIETRFKLRTPIYQETAAYGHMGRESVKKVKTFKDGSGNVKKIEVKLFPWEDLDYVAKLRKEFGKA
jgi:S-adenosylmethionine synthetase